MATLELGQHEGGANWDKSVIIIAVDGAPHALELSERAHEVCPMTRLAQLWPQFVLAETILRGLADELLLLLQLFSLFNRTADN